MANYLRYLGVFLAAIVGGRAGGVNDDLIFITLEEHWVSPSLTNSFLTNPVAQILIQDSFPSDFLPHVLDVGPIRLANMTANQIRIQVVSHASDPAALDQPSLVAEANDQLAASISNDTDRFAGFAVLPMAFPDLAAAELERCVKEHGFLGALVDTHLANGTYYDGDAYRSFWAKAVELDVPIYLHPVWPNPALFSATGSGLYAPAAPPDFSAATSVNLATVAWGWHQDAGLHFLRLYSAGIFDEFPALKIILGHMGEMLPFMLERADAFLSRNASSLSLVETYAQNVWVTTAGFFSLNPLGTVLRNTAVDRILYSVDYPFGNSEQGRAFMMNLKTSGLVNDTEWDMIAFKNAQKLLKLA